MNPDQKQAVQNFRKAVDDNAGLASYRKATALPLSYEGLRRYESGVDNASLDKIKEIDAYGDAVKELAADLAASRGIALVEAAPSPDPVGDSLS